MRRPPCSVSTRARSIANGNGTGYEWRGPAMTLTLRSRIYLTLLPLLALLAVVGTAGAVLLYHLGGRIDAILRENYRSVIYMERLREAVERIDSSFQFALADRDEQARQQFAANWATYRENLRLQ